MSAERVPLVEAAQVLLDDIGGLGMTERIGQINPAALKNLHEAVKAERKKKPWVK